MALAERKAWTQELLEAVGLWDRREHNLHQLSGGEQQRTAISVALANKPVMLLADEPTGEVDSATAQQILDTLRKLNREYNLTIVTVTHDSRVSDQVDRVVTIRDGKTSSERVRRMHSSEEAALASDDGSGPGGEAADGHHVSFHEYVVLDYAGRLQIPREFLDELGISDRAEVDLTDDGILIKPASGRAGNGAQPARAEVAEAWGSQRRGKNWKSRLSGASRGLRGLLGRHQDEDSTP